MELKRKYDNLLKDEDFDKLDLGLKNPNIFQILHITKNEIRHSNFLSWLLDPNQSHKLGDIFLKRFLREVFSSEKFSDIDQVDVEGMDLSIVEIKREWKNIDILIILKDVIVCVENKVLSKEHSNQIKRYKDIVTKQFPNHKNTFVYLNPFGDSSENETETYEPISYEFIVESLSRILSVYGDSLNQQVSTYIKDYITIVKRELMGTDNLTELSRKIYQNHKDLFDFILEHKPDMVTELQEKFTNQIINRGWIMGSSSRGRLRFTTKNIQELSYTNQSSIGWKNRESFLFELLFEGSKNRFYFKVTLSPCDEGYDTTRIKDMLLEIDNFKEPIGKKWLVPHQKSVGYDFSGINEKTDEENIEEFNKVLDKIGVVIEKVENKFIEHKVELLNMKNSML